MEMPTTLKILPHGSSGRLHGYYRVSRETQNEQMQIDALLAQGVPRERIHGDKASGRTTRRKGWHTVNKAMRDGDVLVVWSIDRLSRSVRDLLAIIDDLASRNIRVWSITQSMDATTAIGKLMITITGAFAEYEIDKGSERTKAGLEAAAERGYFPGRPPKLDEKQRAAMVKKFRARPKGVGVDAWAKKVGKEFDVHPETVKKIERKADRAGRLARRQAA